MSTVDDMLYVRISNIANTTNISNFEDLLINDIYNGNRYSPFGKNYEPMPNKTMNLESGYYYM